MTNIDGHPTTPTDEQRARELVQRVINAWIANLGAIEDAVDLILNHDRETAALAIKEYTANPVIAEHAKCTICHLDYIPKRRPSPGRPNYCFNKECLRAKWRQYKRKQRA